MPGRPVHDENNHGADAPRGPAVCTDKITNEVSDRPRNKDEPFLPLDPGAGY